MDTRPHLDESGDRSLETISRERMERLVHRSTSDPFEARPAVAHVAHLCRMRDASPGQLARLAVSEPTFASMLVTLATDGTLTVRASLRDVEEAIAALGHRLVEMIALAAPALRLLGAPEGGLPGVRQEICRHAVRTAVVARELAPPGIRPETALAAGLVHNVGLGSLSLFAPSRLRHALLSGASGGSLPELERAVFGLTHAELGGRLAARWRYPDYLIRAVEEHDQAVPASPLAGVVQIADLLVRGRAIGVEPAAEPSPIVARVARVDLERGRALVTRLLPETSESRNEALATDVPAVRLIEALDGLERAA